MSHSGTGCGSSKGACASFCARLTTSSKPKACTSAAHAASARSAPRRGRRSGRVNGNHRVPPSIAAALMERKKATDEHGWAPLIRVHLCSSVVLFFGGPEWPFGGQPHLRAQLAERGGPLASLVAHDQTRLRLRRVD